MRFTTLFVILLSLACEAQKADSKSSANEPSPNASILPAPLATEVEKALSAERDAASPTADAGSDAGAPEPRYLREDRSLSSDSIAKLDVPGLTLSARFRWPELEQAPRLPESNQETLNRAREQSEFEVSIDLWQGRMRFAFASRAFTLPPGSELRTREDFYGHALIWPTSHTYSIVPAGALRALLAEQRVDVSQLISPRLTTLGTGQLLGFNTERTEIATATGRLELEQGRVIGTLLGTSPLCRLLVELVSAQPNTRVCRPELVPLRAEFVWQAGGRLLFEVQKAIRKSEYAAAELLVPPQRATFRQSELPPLPAAVVFSQQMLADFRTRAVPIERMDSTAPKAGLVIANYSATLRYVLVDGIPVARVRPGTEVALTSLKPGKYLVSARDFFGTELFAPKLIDVPARLAIGEDLK